MTHRSSLGQDQAAELLGDLVSIPSMTPRDADPGDRAPGEAALADFVVGWLAEHDIAATSHQALPGRPNVVAVVPGTTSRTVVLETHLDTVEVDEMTIDPFAAEIRDGRLYGRGACDAKGSLASYLLALATIKGLSEPLPVTVVLAAVADEEHQYRGVLEFLRTHGPDDVDYIGAIVGEPTGLVVAVAHKGVIRFTVHADGRSGHSSRPQDAQSAVVMAARLVDLVESESGSTVTHPLLGSATRTVVRIRGGEGPNVVPGHCEIDIDRRTVPGEDPDEVWERIRAELEAVHPGQVRVEKPFTVDYALDTSPDAQIVRSVRAALSARGLPSEPVGVPFCSDASKFSLLGIPTLVFGPGSILDAHTKDESIDLAEVVTARDIVLEAISTLEAHG